MHITFFYKEEQKAKVSFMAAPVTVMPNLEEGISPRQYAALKGCSLQTAYPDVRQLSLLDVSRKLSELRKLFRWDARSFSVPSAQIRLLRQTPQTEKGS